MNSFVPTPKERRRLEKKQQWLQRHLPKVDPSTRHPSPMEQRKLDKKRAKIMRKFAKCFKFPPILWMNK